MSSELPTLAVTAAALGRPPSSRHPYLLRYRASMVFRIRVPVDIQACLGRKEYRRSLGPSYAQCAKVKSLKLAAAALEVFAFTRDALSARGRFSSSTGGNGYTSAHGQQEQMHMSLDKTGMNSVYTRLFGRTLDSLTDDDIRAIAAEWLLIALKGHDALKAGAAQAHSRNRQSLSPEQIHSENQERTESEARIRQKHTAIHKAALTQRDFTHMRPEADRLLSLCGIHTAGQEDTRQYTRACEELTKARITFYRMEDAYANGDFSTYDEEVGRLAEHRAKAAAQPQIVVEEEESDSITLTEAIEEFFKEKEREGAWRPKVAGMERKKFELFQAVIDQERSMLVSGIKAKHLVRYKELLYLMPANKGKKKEYRDLTPNELIALVERGDVPKDIRMEANTIRTYCQSLTTFINWAARREYHSNPAITGNLQVKAEKQAHEFRDPFTNEDIRRLFAPDVLHQQTKPGNFWIPLLSLFTGARLEELAQLHTDDIVFVNRQEDARPVFVPGQPVSFEAGGGETLCLFINKGKPFQRLKNAASRRYVPLSPVLASELGFLAYVASVFEAGSPGRGGGGEGRLFPELTRKRDTDNFAHSISKWFNTHRNRVGVVPLPGAGKKDFHSFRHTVARWCEQNDVPEKSAARFLGHTHDTMTFGRYGTETAAHMLYGRIAEGLGSYLADILDITGLKASKWAGGR